MNRMKTRPAVMVYPPTMASDAAAMFTFPFALALMVLFSFGGLFSISVNVWREKKNHTLVYFVYVFQSPASLTSGAALSRVCVCVVAPPTVS